MDTSLVITAAEKVIVPLATALIGVSVTLWQTSQKKKDSFEALVSKVEAIETARRVDKEAFANLLKQIQEGMTKDLKSLENALQGKAQEVRQVNRSFNKLVERYTAVEQQLEQARSNIDRHDHELNEFIKDQQKLWQGTNWQIGQMAGWLRNMNRRASGDFPSPTTPKSRP